MLANPKWEAMPKQRILFACYDFRIGGHSSHALNFARALRRRGHAVTALVSEPYGELYSEFRESLERVEIVRRGIESRSAYLRRVVERVNSCRPNILINNVVPCVQASLPFLAPEIVRIFVLHSIHERESRIALANVAFLDSVVAVSDNVREHFERLEPGQIPVSVIPVGLELPPEGRRRTSARVPLRLIYVGRIEPEKNLPGLLRVLSALQSASVPFSMTIVGSGKQLQAVQAQASQLPFSERVQFLGARGPREVSRLLAEHDFLLLTSLYEGTPHAALEAMAHGLVVLASRLPGATDRIITDDVDGYLCNREAPLDYVKVLAGFAGHPESFAAVSHAARAKVASCYSADVLATQYESLFGPADGFASNRVGIHLAPGVQIPVGLRPEFPGLVMQCKHRLADAYRWLARGERAAGPE